MSTARRHVFSGKGRKRTPKPLQWFCERCERVRLQPVKGAGNVLVCSECASPVEILGSTGQTGNPVATRLEGHQLARHVWICRACDRWHEEKPKLVKGSRLCASCDEPTLHFDSKGEAIAFQALKLEVGEGRKRNLRHHPKAKLFAVAMLPANELGDGRWKHELVELGHYEADAAFEELVAGAWVEVWLDYKPRNVAGIDKLAQWKIRHFESQAGIKVRIVTQ